MNYLIIAYKSNSDDYCRGCHMASYSSDFEFVNTNDREKAIRFLVEKINYVCDTGESGFDFTIFIDGKTTDVNDNSGNTDEDLYHYEPDYEQDPARLLMAEARKVAQYEKEHAEEVRKQQKEREEAAAKVKAAREKEERDRKDYERLKLKFEGETSEKQ